MDSKRNKPKANKFPETVLAFYIKLYCKQKGTSETKYQSILVEATKTWLSLTEEQRQQVCESYKEEEHKYKLQCFDQLKNAQPFMKVKEPIGLLLSHCKVKALLPYRDQHALSRLLVTRWDHLTGTNEKICPQSKNEDLNDSNSVIQEPEVHNREETLQTETEHVNLILNDEDMNLSDDGELEPDIEPERNQDGPSVTEREPVQHTIEETPRTFLVEPLPPTLKTSKDLFFMLNPAGGAESVSWTTLTTFEKNQYKRAVCLLKTDYITKYREYLESLNPRELYDYYNKTLF